MPLLELEQGGNRKVLPASQEVADDSHRRRCARLAEGTGQGIPDADQRFVARDDERRMTIFGEEGDEPLLGATTLGSLGLVLDPFKRRLIPMRMVLA